VGIKVGGVGVAQAFFGEVVALATGDLAIEDTEQRAQQMRMLVHAEHDLIGREQPVEFPPDLAAIDFLRAHFLGEITQGLDAAEKGGYMRVMAVAGIVKIQNLRLGMLEDEFQIGDARLMARALHLLARVAELNLNAVLAHEGCFALLQKALLLHLLIGVARIGTFARAASSIGHDDTTEPLVLVVKTLRDAVIGGDFEIVLMRNNAEVRHATQRGPRISVVRNENVVLGMAELHGWGGA
jgi:hypothetical protein